MVERAALTLPDICPKCTASLLDEPDAAALSLRHLYEVRYDIGDSGERGDDGLPLDWMNWAERYKKGKLEVVMRLHADGGSAQRDLVLLGVPFVGQHDTAWRQSKKQNIIDNAFKSYFGNDPVFTAVTNLVKRPNGSAFPSLVRFERPKKREDIRWQVLASLAAYHVRLELRGGVGDREISRFGLPFAPEDCGGKSEMVESRPEMFDRLNDQHVKDIWERFGQSEFMCLCAAIRIRLCKKTYGRLSENVFPLTMSVFRCSFARPTRTLALRYGSSTIRS